MSDPIDEQKLANERTDHIGRPRKEPQVPKESFEGNERVREGADVERPREGVERERP